MHNIVNKVLLIIVIILIALFAYKTINTQNATSAMVDIDSTNKTKTLAEFDLKKTEEVVKEYLLNNPEVIIQSIEGLQRRKMQEMEKKTEKYIKDNKSELEDSSKSPVLGNPDGDVIISVFYDYNCSYCKKGNDFITQLVNLDNNVKVILKVFPVLGDSSNYAASVALAVFKNNPDKFAIIHEGLIEMKPITQELVENLLIENNLNPEIVNNEINDEEIINLIDKNMQLAKNLKIQGVPAYIIDGKLVPGMVDLQRLQKMISDIRSQNKK